MFFRHPRAHLVEDLVFIFWIKNDRTVFTISRD